ncbi:probable helicase senataxin [Caerostris extrusa]|uniref:Probable helicase senataxin n=1 Tax=Caerostris extrusa TaxID=172846 RepID=A0AAV4SH40_CAEEX|nr:probable helicase senataxin [Caerostris extrusa]
MYENTVLRESNVILTTLYDSMNPLMNEFFETGQEGQRIYCIVDDASRCTEPEILQCLNTEVKRLILVGDIQQLPPSVSSTYAINWGFRRSMLERLYKYIRKQNCSIPTFSLTEQHRMRSQISHFPSKYFYGNQLETAPDTEERFLYCPLKPAIVYDILTNISGMDGQDLDGEETSFFLAFVRSYCKLFRMPFDWRDCAQSQSSITIQKYAVWKPCIEECGSECRG